MPSLDSSISATDREQFFEKTLCGVEMQGAHEDRVSVQGEGRGEGGVLAIVYICIQKNDQTFCSDFSGAACRGKEVVGHRLTIGTAWWAVVPHPSWPVHCALGSCTVARAVIAW